MASRYPFLKIVLLSLCLLVFIHGTNAQEASSTAQTGATGGDSGTGATTVAGGGGKATAATTAVVGGDAKGATDGAKTPVIVTGDPTVMPEVTEPDSDFSTSSTNATDGAVHHIASSTLTVSVMLGAFMFLSFSLLI